MPYQWNDTPTPEQRLELWPHQSLTPQGFVLFFAITAGFFLVPISSVFGTVVLWYILPFIVGTVTFLWLMLRRSFKDGTLRETLTIGDAEMRLLRQNPRGPNQSWEANPYWVRVALHEQGGPVENYVTLSGAGREVEIGAFLSPEERQALYGELQDRLRRLDMNAP